MPLVAKRLRRSRRTLEAILLELGKQRPDDLTGK
jgi:hypothetical protein